MSKKIVLIAPRLENRWETFVHENRECLGLGYIASYLESKGYSVKVINADSLGWDNSTIIEDIHKEQFLLIGVSVVSQKSYPTCKILITELRKIFPTTHITMGGIFPSICYEDILRDIPVLDSVVVGEGELTTYNLAEILHSKRDDYESIKGLAFLKNNEVHFTLQERIFELASLPFAKREELDFSRMRVKNFHIIAGRGCYANCAFCSLQKNLGFTRKIYRDYVNVIDEIEELIGKYGITYFPFHDDIFFDYSKIGLNWIYGFINEVQKRKVKFNFRIYLRANDVKEKEISSLREIGLSEVFLGLESGIDRILKEMNKHTTAEQGLNAVKILQNNHIHTVLGYIPILPTLTFAELKENYAYLLKLGCIKEDNFYDKLNVLSGCTYESILGEKGLLLPKSNFWQFAEYTFADNKVGCFASKLSNMRDMMIPVRKLLKQYESICMESHTLNNYVYFERKEIVIWKELIIDLIHLIEDQYPNIKDFQLSEISKRIQVFETELVNQVRLITKSENISDNR